MFQTGSSKTGAQKYGSVGLVPSPTGDPTNQGTAAPCRLM